MKKRQVVIIGAGASGLMAAIMAARNGAAVTVLEQNEKPGKKICATGNGKCNFSNLVMPDDAYRGKHPEFVNHALAQFSVKDTVEFFKKLGIFPLDKNGYLYPRSNQAQSVVDVLCMEASNLGIKIKTNEQVIAIETEKNGRNFQVLTKGWHYEADALILANGSKASAISGSDGSGYELAESLKHHIIPVYPALTALKCKGPAFKVWAGVRTEGEVSLFIDGKFYKSERGELQLTEYGISGIPVFQISTYAIRAVRDGHKAALRINFMPELSEEESAAFLEDLGLEESGLTKLIKASYALLGLINYFTAGEMEARAWTIVNGTKAPQAAGKIHSDIEKGFIRAEIVSFDDLQACGSQNAAKEKGLVRLEGKDYVMKDGDVTHFRFNV